MTSTATNAALLVLGLAWLLTWVWVIVLSMRRGTGWGAVAIFFSPIVALSLLVLDRKTAWKAASAHLLATVLFFGLVLSTLLSIGRDFENIQPALLQGTLDRCTSAACRETINGNALACNLQAKQYWPHDGDLTLVGEATERYARCLNHGPETTTPQKI